MKKSIFFLLLIIVAGSFVINLFVDSEATRTTINIIGLVAIIVIAFGTRMNFSKSSEN
ncbi:hypothetical protein KP77_05060 [Jeotgalibacillus alimentarius]|uniref:Uncharacterized protein n=1 Tax=Jeotgalibacillus alimentarius TaxID=135826 RepID=A0A0C2RTJ1_9BACL|nr:hypothetical protein [Jeotgalibacillus alimentarius]KIL53530.1 hypothetical protein KP77_05060 [Jeotgalibacillus alimentarius]